jgi:transcriptional regulator with XRE-family HTH domain
VAAVTSVEVVAERSAFGVLLKEWRARRRVSQLDLAIAADVSARHVSFLETGRSRPSRDMVLRLAERLEVPLRERDPLLVAAGFAPAHPVRPLDDPALAPIRAAVDTVLAGYGPYPALAVDRHWRLVAANPAVELVTAPAADFLKEPPVNVLRLSLHPEGLAPYIANLAEWRGHLLGRLAREAAADPELAGLRDELRGYPGGLAPPPEQAVAVPLRIRLGDRTLAFISTVTTFGTALDVTAAELSIEAFLPADAATASALQG